ncbi:unnamed protein product, partial [Symbiodinium sp. KB8]
MPILLIAYESLKATRAREVEELDPRPYEDFTVEEFLEKLPGPTLEEVDEPMDAAGSSEDAPADLPLGEMAELSNQDTSNVPMETDAPESSPQGKVKKEGDDKDQATGSPPQGEELMPDIASSNDATAGGTLHDQGIWEAENVVDPKVFENLAEASEKLGIKDTEEYKTFVCDHYRIERSSPLMRLADQQYGYGQSGLYHDGVRVDDIGSFKEDLKAQMCKMDPIDSRQPERLDVIFRSGDVRSTWDDRQMARASKAREETLEVNQAGSCRRQNVHDVEPATCVILDPTLMVLRPTRFLPGLRSVSQPLMDECELCVIDFAGLAQHEYVGDSKVANKKVGLPHECFASMFMDCLHYQVDLIGGDANMALYRYSGSKQESTDIRG